MIKLLLITLLIPQVILIHAQQNQLIFKKNRKIINHYWNGSVLAFQLEDQEWRKGEIIRITNDSFYIRSMIVQYHLLGSDTIHFPPDGFSISDIYAMPKKGVLIDYIDGRYQISRAGGHLHWYWIKSGWIFRVVGAGYVGLVLVNGLIQNNFSWSENAPQFAIAAAVFAVGFILKKTYSLVLRTGNKYKMSALNLSN